VDKREENERKERDGTDRKKHPLTPQKEFLVTALETLTGL